MLFLARMEALVGSNGSYLVLASWYTEVVSCSSVLISGLGGLRVLWTFLWSPGTILQKNTLLACLSEDFRVDL